MRINDVEFNVDVADVIDELVTQLRLNHIQYIEKRIVTSKGVQICCPYHAGGMERRPSAGIRKEDGLFHCFACGEVHSLPEVITHCFGHDDDVLGKFGWNWLLKNFATVQVEERKDVNLDFERHNKISRNIDSIVGNTNSNYVSEEELDKYRYYHPYWAERKITDEKIIELFDLGYDIDTACVTMPVRDREGNTLFVARRSVKFKYFNYPKDVQKPLYGLFELGSLQNFPDEVIVTESMIDALSFWQIGKYAVALNGTGTDLQFKQLNDLPCRKIILATDSDDAGMKARQRLKKHIHNKIITEYIFPKGRKDANECTEDELKNLEEFF